MLTVYRSNRAELLAELLATQLRLSPPDPFEQVQVLVNTWPTSRWLGEQLAVHLGGIAANLRFPFPGVRLRRLVEQVLGEDVNEAGPAQAAAAEVATDPWRANGLVWPLLELLPAIAEQPEAAPLRRWLEGRDLGQRLERGSWQLGRAIADAFDDYALYRPELLAAWERGAAVDALGRPLPAAQLWQPLLYRALRQRLDGLPFGLRVGQAIERLRSGAGPVGQLGGPLRLFGLSSLAPVQVQLLQALSGSMAVDIYLLTPCRDLWQRCAERRDRLSDALALEQPLDADWLLRAQGLEARFGRLGGEFQQLLEGTGDTQLGCWEERDLFFAPATAAQDTAPSTRPAPLLAQLQEQLADPERVPRLVREEGDHSLEFHPCPGPLRQVQILRDRLLQLMAADPSLEPRHILIMTPQVDRFAPLVASVFGDSGATGVELPWRLTDRSQQGEAGMGRTLLDLLALAGERFTATALECLLECGPLLRRFDIEPQEARQLSGVLQRCGFRWGLDGLERGGDPTHSLSWAIDRLLLGLVLPDSPGLAPADTAPWSAGVSIDLLGRWLHLLTRLRHWLGQLRRACGCGAWAARLQSLLADLFGDGGDAAWELPAVLAAIDDWQQVAAGCELLLEAPVVAAVLDERLAAESGRFGHRSGALTISALEPMRAIPHRVIVLMGLDAGVFPRQSQRPGFHLMERQRRLGDPSPVDQDRYVLLEALLSARDHLLISWSCRDERSGEELQPATPVRQWQQWLKAQLGQAAAGLTLTHAANPLDRANFRPLAERPPASCDRRLLETLRLLEAGPPQAFPALAQAAPPEGLPPTSSPQEPFEDLRGWLMEPQKQWLLGLGLRPREWDERIDDLEQLELEERQRALLLRQVQGSIDDGGIEPALAEDWLQRSRGQGLLPPRAAGELEARALQRRWSSLRACLDQLGPSRQEPLAWGPWRAAPLWRGDAVVLIHTARERVPQRMDLWLQLLLATAAGLEGGPVPRQGLLIAREKDSFKAVLQLAAPNGAEARTELERLAALRHDWRLPCWPVPPRTGMAYLAAERKSAGTGAAKAAAAWEGSYGRPGERQQDEMVICFGADLSADSLVEADFAAWAASLYGPLLEAQLQP